MAGHSKWANMKHRKDRADRKKGKVFTRVTKEIISAVKQGGTDPKGNSRLRLAIQKAKEANMPSENIERNIKKASSADQQDYTEMSYELYGYGGVGIIVEIMTDNKNRISSDIRIATNKHGGTIATPGAVAYNFDRKGVVKVLKSTIGEEPLFLLVSEAGAEDLKEEEECYTIFTSVESLHQIKQALTQANIKWEEADLQMVPKSCVAVSDEDANSNIALIEYLESLDDVDTVYHNMSIE